MKTLIAGVVLLCFLAWPTGGRALEPTDGCKIGGIGTTLGGIACPDPKDWREATFSVTAVCSNSCTGKDWQVNSGSFTAEGPSCSTCPAKLLCEGCPNRISDQLVKVYTELQAKRLIGQLCVNNGKVKAEVACSCPGCGDPSPIVISLSDQQYQLTDAANGVLFDLDGDGVAEQTAWTAAGSDQGFLALDRNLNGQIDDFMEVFGDHTPQLPSDEPNGWLALALWDDTLNGGNEDGVIDAADYIFSALQIWVDRNHNGFSEPRELSSLEDEGVEYLSLDYDGDKGWVDEFGNGFRFPSRVGRADGSVTIAWDVFFGNQ